MNYIHLTPEGTTLAESKWTDGSNSMVGNNPISVAPVREANMTLQRDEDLQGPPTLGSNVISRNRLVEIESTPPHRPNPPSHPSFFSSLANRTKNWLNFTKEKRSHRTGHSKHS